MNLSLKDIIDLDFLLALDEAGASPDSETISARDRDIFHQLENGPDLDDAGIIRGWLEYRRLLFFHETGKGGPGAKLPGTLFDSYYSWTARGAALLGFTIGGMGAYSFLAYHGSRPVNVTLFTAVFIMLPMLLCLAAAGVAAHQIRSGGEAGAGWFGVMQRLSVQLFINKFTGAVKKWGAPVKKYLPELSDDAVTLLRLDTGPYRNILFWPVFIALSLGALGFSLGALGGTFFRIMVTDLAFGWQSTLPASAQGVHQLVTLLALPWSWALPGAVPTLVQIEGSRILLKEGIAGLASEHLAAWWPFLCVGMLVYAVIPRLCLLALAFAARRRALSRFDLARPGYQRLIMRMRSPRMGTDIRSTGGSRAKIRGPLPRPVSMAPPQPEPIPESGPDPVPDVMPGPPPGTETVFSPLPGPDATVHEGASSADTPEPDGPGADLSARADDLQGLLLGSARGLKENRLAEIQQGLLEQFGLSVSEAAGIQFDFDLDRDRLAFLAKVHGKQPVVILQEVWQPPIRGLLYYFVQIREQIFPDSALWIVVVQSLDQGDMAVDTADVNFQVWKTAIKQLNDPMMVIERWTSS